MRALAVALVLLAPVAVAIDLPQPAPDSIGFSVAPFTAIVAPTAIAFDAAGALYATTLTGDVVRVATTPTAAGLVATGAPETIARGFGQALGIAVGPDGEIYVATSGGGLESGRTDGKVFRLDGAVRKIVVDGLPNGRHNTNHLRFAPDGRLAVANGNPSDNGIDGGFPDLVPWGGAILSFDVDEIDASPAIVHWRADPTLANTRIPDAQVADHAVNADFRAKVQVLGLGFRNVFGVAFAADGSAYTAMNGMDTPSSQDGVYRMPPATSLDFRFPECRDIGAPGAVGAGVAKEANPIPAFAATDCSDAPRATALLGWHVCATGLDIAPATFGGFGGDLFVGECTPFFADPSNDGVSEHNTAHKVARVELDDAGEAVAVHEFLVGLPLPLDVLFGPDGAMYYAGAEGILRVAPVV